MLYNRPCLSFLTVIGGFPAPQLVIACTSCKLPVHPFPTPLGNHKSVLLLPALQKWWLSNLVFLYLLSRLCPYCICRQLILVPCTFFVFCCLRRHLSRCKHCSRGSQAPACLASPRPFSFRVSVSSTRRRDWDGGPVSRSLAVPSAQWLPASLGFQVICVDSEQLSLGCRSLYPTCLIKNHVISPFSFLILLI